MVNKRNLAMAAVAVIGIGIGFFLVFQSDEAKIKQQFSVMADKIEKQADESDLMAAASAHGIENLFGPSVRIEIPSYSVDQTFSKPDISAHALYFRGMYQEMTISFHDFQIQFPCENTAEVGLTAVFQAVTANGEPVKEIHEAACTLENINDAWLFTGIRGVDVLEK